MTVTAPAPKPRRTAKPKPPPEPRADLLRRLLADIEAHDHHAHRQGLYERLFAEGMRVKTDEDGLTTLRLHGLTEQSTAAMAGALMVWARAARRELLALDAEAAPSGAA